MDDANGGSRVGGLRVLVTGGVGFVGSHLCERLLAESNEVIALDDFSTGSPGNVAHLMRSSRFWLVEQDVTAAFNYEVDRIYHLASPVSPTRYQEDPVRTTITNVVGTLHALLCAERQGARLLLASTSEVYGDPEVHPQDEGYLGRVNPIGSRACYDEGKRCAESLATDFHRKGRAEVRIARIFNTYGPRMATDDGRAVSNWLRAPSGAAARASGDDRQHACGPRRLRQGSRRRREGGPDRAGELSGATGDQVRRRARPKKKRATAMKKKVMKSSFASQGVTMATLIPAPPALPARRASTMKLKHQPSMIASRAISVSWVQ